MAPTSAFGEVVRKPKRSASTSPSLTLRTDFHFGTHMPAKKFSGRSSLNANQMSPPSALLNSLNEENGTTQRFSTPSQRRQCGEAVLRIFVTPGSRFDAANSFRGVGMPQRVIVST